MRDPVVEPLEFRTHLDAGDLDRSYGGDGAAESFSTLAVRHRTTNDALVLADGRTVVAANVTGPQVDVIDEFFELTRFTSSPVLINQFPLGDLIEITRFTAGGFLDPTFGGDGVLRIAFSDAGSTGRGNIPAAMALDADGNLLVAGSAGDSLFLARFKPNGDRDPSFNGGFGVLGITIPNRIVTGNALAVAADGSIVVAGNITDGVTPTRFDALVARFTSDGLLDSSFGVGGQVVTSFGFNAADVNAAAIDADGNIVLAGQATIGHYDENIDRALLLRLSADGTIDRSFGAAGGVVDGSQTPALRFSDVLVEPESGNILALSGRDAPVTRSDGPVAIYRYTSRGAPDVEFGDIGVQSLSVKLDTAQSMARQRNGKIIIGGDASGAALVRLNRNGSRDDTFGFSGFADGLGVRGSPQIALGPDGTIAVAGLAPSNLAQGVARVFSDAAPAALVRALKISAPRSGSYKFTIDYRDSDGVDADTFDSADVRIVNSANQTFRARFVSAAGADGDGRIVATYKLAPVSGSWGSEDNGVYRIVLGSNRVFDVAGNGSLGRTLGAMRISLPEAQRAAPMGASASSLPPTGRLIDGIV